MRALLISPKFPPSFWTFNRLLDMSGLKVSNPPLGIITIAAMLPGNWEIRFRDRNVSEETEADWAWCDIVLLTAMIAQQKDFRFLIEKAVRLGKRVAVGGPYPTAMPDTAIAAGAHYLVLGEGETTVPQFVKAVSEGSDNGVFRAQEWADLTRSPIPRFDLLQLDAYFGMSIQVTRGCPYPCEFCEIPGLWGQKPRSKSPGQVIKELEMLYQLGWRGSLLLAAGNRARSWRISSCLAYGLARSAAP
jgi:radical SAM superfamily enzyme YgiQ (UPF0313 family)